MQVKNLSTLTSRLKKQKIYKKKSKYSLCHSGHTKSHGLQADSGGKLFYLNHNLGQLNLSLPFSYSVIHYRHLHYIFCFFPNYTESILKARTLSSWIQKSTTLVLTYWILKYLSSWIESIVIKNILFTFVKSSVFKTFSCDFRWLSQQSDSHIQDPISFFMKYLNLSSEVKVIQNYSLLYVLNMQTLSPRLYWSLVTNPELHWTVSHHTTLEPFSERTSRGRRKTKEETVTTSSLGN